MPQWMDDLDELIKGMGKPAPAAKDDGYDDGDEDDDGDGDGMVNDGEEDEKPVKKAASSREGCYPPADNGDDDDETGEMPNGAAVRDADKIDRYTNGNGRGAGKIKKKKINAGDEANKVAKGIRDLVDSEAAEVIDGAHTLGQMVDALDTLVTRVNKSLRNFDARMAQVEAGQAIIGKAVTKSLQGNSAILKSLAGEVEEIGRQPRGRKAVTKAVDRKFPGNDAPAPQNREVIMLKSLEALKAGRINAIESASVDTFMNRGIPLPPALLAKINGG